MRMVRQGDVLLIAVNSLPSSKLSDITPNDNEIVLAYGEVTGHKHAIRTPNARLLRQESNGDRFVHVREDSAQLVHEEHSPITLDKGVWKVVQQRQYEPRAHGHTIPVAD